MPSVTGGRGRKKNVAILSSSGSVSVSADCVGEGGDVNRVAVLLLCI
jgi:hypothetical protein